MDNALLESLITSKTRIRLLLKFFLNPDIHAHLRELAIEFDTSTNAVRIELNRLTKAEVLDSMSSGRTIKYWANLKHPFFREISSVVRKMVGLDQVIENILSELGGLERAFISGDYASGRDSGLIDLVLVGEINRTLLDQLIPRTEMLINRKIRTLVLAESEFDKLKKLFMSEPILLLWGELHTAVVDI